MHQLFKLLFFRFVSVKFTEADEWVSMMDDTKRPLS